MKSSHSWLKTKTKTSQQCRNGRELSVNGIYEKPAINICNGKRLKDISLKSGIRECAILLFLCQIALVVLDSAIRQNNKEREGKEDN